MKKSLIALAVLAASMCLAGAASAQPVGPDAPTLTQVKAKAGKAKSDKPKTAKKHKTGFVEMADTACEAGKGGGKAPPAKPSPKPMPGKKGCLTASTEPDPVAPDGGEPQPATPGDPQPVNGIRRLT